MRGAHALGEGFLKFSDLGPGGQPIGAQHIDHGLNVGLVDRLPPVRKKVERTGEPPLIANVPGLTEVVLMG